MSRMTGHSLAKEELSNVKVDVLYQLSESEDQSTCQLAKPRGLANWQVDWSSDSESWYRTSTFTLDNSSLAKECPVILDIPQNLAIPQGGNLYIRIKPKDLTPCQEGDVPYFDETSDPRIIGDISIRRL